MSANGSRHLFPFRILFPLVALLATLPVSAQATFTGRVTDQVGLGIADVAVVAQGNQTGTRVSVSDGQGNYSLSIGANTNIRIRAYRSSYILNPVLAGFSSIGGSPIMGIHALNFSGTALPFPILVFSQAPILLTEDESLNALALDSVLQTRDPFAPTTEYIGANRETRLQLYLVDMDLFTGETLSSISVSAVDMQQSTHVLVVEDLRKVPGVPWLSQLTVCLPPSLTGPRDLNVTVSARTQVSNAAKIHVK